MDKHEQFWCSHVETMTDDEGQELCVRCGTVYYQGPLRERDLLDFCDAVWAQEYDRPGLPPSFTLRLKNTGPSS